MDKLTLIALVAMSTINHNGTLYGPGQDAGDRFECNDKDAAPLLACAAAKLASEVDAAANAPVATASPAAPGLDAEAEIAKIKAEANTAVNESLAAVQEAEQLATAEKARADDLQAQLDALKATQAAAPVAGAAKAAGKK